MNPKTGQREAIGPHEIKPEFAREYNDEVFNKAMKVELPPSAFDEAGRSFDYFFNKMARKYEGHAMEDLAPFIEGGRVAPWDAQGIPHRVKRGKVELRKCNNHYKSLGFATFPTLKKVVGKRYTL